MQLDLQTNDHLAEVIRTASSIAIIPAKLSPVDSFCAGASVHLMLKLLEKRSKIFYPGAIPDVCKDLVDEKDIISSFSQRQLTVSIDYSGEHEAKAWYEPETEILKVKLAPVSKDFDPALKVKTRLDTGFDFDTAIVLGANEFEDLGYMFTEIQRDLAKATIVDISNSGKNSRFGSINVVDPMCDTLSQLIVKRAPLWDLNITTEAAKALLVGITQK